MTLGKSGSGILDVVTPEPSSVPHERIEAEERKGEEGPNAH